MHDQFNTTFGLLTRGVAQRVVSGSGRILVICAALFCTCGYGSISFAQLEERPARPNDDARDVLGPPPMRAVGEARRPIGEDEPDVRPSRRSGAPGGGPPGRPAKPVLGALGRPGEPGVGPRQRAHWERLREVDPELYELEKADHDYETASRDLALQFSRASSESRETIRQRLSETIAKHFDVRQARRRLQLRRLEEELAKTREAVEERDAARDELLAKRLSELIGESDTPGF